LKNVTQFHLAEEKTQHFLSSICLHGVEFSEHNQATLNDWLVALFTDFIPWCRTFFKKMIVTQLVKKYPAFIETSSSLLCSEKSRH